MQSENVIHLSGVSKSFGKKHVLHGFNLELKRGENLVVLGKSGSGKSVLIKCIIGLLQADAGKIEVFDKNIPKLTAKELNEVRTKIGFLFQNNALYDSMTVRENLEFPLRRHKAQHLDKKVNELVLEALTQVGLEDTIDLNPSDLSGGMKKRVSLARTLILNPEIMLYDEPTTGLDSITGREISTLIRDLSNKHKTSSIIISHDLNCVKIVADRILVLIDGKCYATGTYKELHKSDDEQIRKFFE